MNATLRWLARREIGRLKWRGLAGLALIVFAAGFALSVLLPVKREIGQLEAEYGQMRKKLRASADGPGAPAPTRAGQLENFYAFFPATDSLPEWIGKLHTAAAHNGLTLDSGEYRMQQGPRERLSRYQIKLPLKASYPQLRAFVAETLDRIPAAALEDIVVRRESIGSQELDAQVTFTLYLGGGS